ncbi:tellurium resistance protein terb [Anopheles sinensis]|uniref:Tellurium resistance protein terb n=1 Tax=Anopheles sinensis TaxID=74873 RepID=A0A084VYL4_ANOSI|nr:tellurium resistance protein terb [Anopheles sinensis]
MTYNLLGSVGRPLTVHYTLAVRHAPEPATPEVHVRCASTLCIGPKIIETYDVPKFSNYRHLAEPLGFRCQRRDTGKSCGVEFPPQKERTHVASAPWQSSLGLEISNGIIDAQLRKGRESCGPSLEDLSSYFMSELRPP